MTGNAKNNKSFAVTIKEYIDKNYSDWKISMNVFTGLVGFSAVYINRVFKKTYGMNPIEYLQKVRLEKVKTFIELGMPLGMAAYQAGYSSLRTLYRVFERDTGMSPGVYKQRFFKVYEHFSDVVGVHDLRPLDYARKACNAIMMKYDPTRLAPCAVDEDKTLYSYVNGIFLNAMYGVYKKTNELRYLNYISEWVDTVIEADGDITSYKNHPRIMKGSDAMQPMRVIMSLYNETGKERCIKAADRLINVFLADAKTMSGVFLNGGEDCVCINSAYMVCPSMCLYAQTKDRNDLYDIATQQPIRMYEHMLNNDTGLLYHSWDETKSADWCDIKTGLSYEVWGRGMGYYIMGVLDILDYLPKTHPDRAVLIEIINNTLNAIAKYQHETGRWYQILDGVGNERNWFENSCSCMFAYAFAKAVNLGIGNDSFANTAVRAYGGVIDTIGYGESGEMLLGDISKGVQSGDGYLEKERTINDNHGMGAFVLMCTEIEKLLNNM